MRKYLIVDAVLNGSGIRDYYEGGYINPLELHLSSELVTLLNSWLLRYWDAFYMNYQDKILVDALDVEGINIAQLIQKELGSKMLYFSDATQRKTILS